MKSVDSSILVPLTKRTRVAECVVAALLLTALTACGGGGGSSGDTVGIPSPPNNPPSGSVPNPPPSDPAPPAPNDATVETARGKATIEWDPVEKADGYNVYYAKDPYLTPDTYDSVGGVRLEDVSSPLVVEGLEDGAHYYFIVTAFMGEEESEPTKTVAVMLPAPISNVATGALNDTGATTCSTSDQAGLECPQPGFPQQDAEHGRDAEARAGTLVKAGAGAAGFDFMKISNGGFELPANATLGDGPDDWACTLDRVTGLLWEVRPDQADHLRHRGHIYTWFSEDAGANGGHAGTANGGLCVGSACDTSAYVAAVNAAKLCGFDDWRLPTVNELASLVHHGRIEPAIDTDFFPDTPSVNALYWTQTPYASDPQGVWTVDFTRGELATPYKHLLFHLRLVRAEK